MEDACVAWRQKASERCHYSLFNLNKISLIWFNSNRVKEFWSQWNPAVCRIHQLGGWLSFQQCLKTLPNSSPCLSSVLLCVFCPLAAHTHIARKPVCGLQKCDDSAVTPFALHFVLFHCLQAATLNIAISPFYSRSLNLCFVRPPLAPARYCCPVGAAEKG